MGSPFCLQKIRKGEIMKITEMLLIPSLYIRQHTKRFCNSILVFQSWFFYLHVNFVLQSAC